MVREAGTARVDIPRPLFRPPHAPYPLSSFILARNGTRWGGEARRVGSAHHPWVESKARTFAATALRGEESKRKAADSARREAMLSGQSKKAAGQRIDTERAVLGSSPQPAELELRARALAGLNAVIVKAIGHKTWREGDILRGKPHATPLQADAAAARNSRRLAAVASFAFNPPAAVRSPTARPVAAAR